MTPLSPILFVDHASVIGGAEGLLLGIGNVLVQRGWNIHLACPEGDYSRQAIQNHFTFHALTLSRLRRSPSFGLDWLRGANDICKLARRVGAKILYANTVRASLYTALAALVCRLPFIWHMQDFWLSESAPKNLAVDRLGKLLLQRSAESVIVTSKAVAEIMPLPVRVVRNGIEVGRFTPTMDGNVFREQYGILGDAPVAGVVGRLRPWKGQDRFVRAMARVAERLPEARFLIVGGEIFGVQDDFERDLHALVESLGLAERVIFTGQVADVRPAFAAMDVFVHPGEPEPFGLVNIEAMAMGKPVVAFEHGALPEIVADGQTGRLVSPGDVGALAAAVLALLQDPAQARRMGAAGRARVETHFTIQQTAAGVEQILYEVLR